METIARLGMIISAMKYHIQYLPFSFQNRFSIEKGLFWVEIKAGQSNGRCP